MAKQVPLSESARSLLEAAASREDRLAIPPHHLPIAAQRSVVQSLLKAGLIAEIDADDDQPTWRVAETGERYTLRATDAGMAAVAPPGDPEDDLPPGSESADAGDEVLLQSLTMPASEAVAPTPVEQRQLPNVRAAAGALLQAWDATSSRPPLLAPHVEALRATMMTTRNGKSRQVRPDTKRAAVIALLGRAEGATVAQVVEATEWARHTVHGFFVGLKKAGIQVEVLERVRQVGPGKQGAAGSYTVYRIGKAS